MDCSPLAASVHGIPQARILEWDAISFSRESFWSRDWTLISCVFCIGRRVLYHCATCEGPHEIFKQSSFSWFYSLKWSLMLPNIYGISWYWESQIWQSGRSCSEEKLLWLCLNGFFPYLMGKLINISSLSLIVGNSRFSFFLYLLKSHSQQAIERYHNLFEKLLYVKFP